MTKPFFKIGRNKRAEYGKRIVLTLSTQLRHEYGRNEYNERNLRRMM
ncbi:MAG: hypothetical protein J1F16_00075 [Muribaculaceae bacterium]|nr:hypothetical protein [Muribaculaceae bacterium]